MVVEGNLTQNKTIGESAKRRAPRVAHVLHKGIRYEILQGARTRGFKQNGGVISAIDVSSGKELWTLLVYATQYDESEESDVQDVFITEMHLSSEGRALHLKTEDQRNFVVNLSDRSVTEVK